MWCTLNYNHIVLYRRYHYSPLLMQQFKLVHFPCVLLGNKNYSIDIGSFSIVLFVAHHWLHLHTTRYIGQYLKYLKYNEGVKLVIG